MAQKQTAIKIFGRFDHYTSKETAWRGLHNTRQCCNIHIDGIIEELTELAKCYEICENKCQNKEVVAHLRARIKYWNEIKAEVQNL